LRGHNSTLYTEYEPVSAKNLTIAPGKSCQDVAKA